MNFVFVSYNPDPGFDSPERWLERISVYSGVLQQLAKNHTVTRVKPVDLNATKIQGGVTYRFVNCSPKSLRFAVKLNRVVKNLKPDVVVVHGLHNPLQVLQLRWQLPKGVRIIAQNHAEKPARGIRKLLQRIADRYIGAYLFASREMGMDWVNRGNLASAKNIHEVMEVSSTFYPVDRSLAQVKTRATGKPIFLWVGRLDQNKDPLNVINAFLRYADLCPGARLYMIYHTEELLGNIQHLLNKHPNGSMVTMVGKIAHNQLLYWYNSADFIISGSHYEGSGTAVCEAMSCGCVPTFTDIFSFRMMTDNGMTGLLYEAGNQQQLFTTLVKSEQLDMPTEREKALAFFKSTLSFQAIARRFEEIAASLVI